MPTATLAFFVILAPFTIWVDSRLGELLGDIPLILSATVSGGRGIATTVAAATITVAAIVFSITALSTQMAASQYSPRALGGFFENPFQQFIIGLVVGTFTYALLILAGLGNILEDPNGATPSLSITLTILFGVASALGIVAYINHSLRRMQIDSVVLRIADAALASVRRELGETEDEVSEASPPQGETSHVTAGSTGWVVGIDSADLVAGLPPSTTARIDVKVGDAVSEGDHIATLWSDASASEDETIEPLVRRSIRLSPTRSIASDPTFGIRQLVDIALKALSPGINDPTTAVDVLYHLKIPIREVLVSDPPRRVFTGARDQRVYLAETPSRSDYVHMAFAEIRLAAGRQLSVIEALVDVLENLESELSNADLSGRASAVEAELRLTLEMARDSGLPSTDLERVFRKEIEDGSDEEETTEETGHLRAEGQ